MRLAFVLLLACASGPPPAYAPPQFGCAPIVITTPTGDFRRCEKAWRCYEETLPRAPRELDQDCLADHP